MSSARKHGGGTPGQDCFSFDLGRAAVGMGDARRRESPKEVLIMLLEHVIDLQRQRLA